MPVGVDLASRVIHFADGDPMGPVEWQQWAIQANAKLTQLGMQLTAITQALASGAGGGASGVGALTAFVEGNRAPKTLRMNWPGAQIVDRNTGRVLMSGTVNCTSDHDVKIPLVWKDDMGVVSAPTAGTTATSDTAAVISTVDVAADDMSITCRVAGAGTATVTVTNGTMSDTVSVVVSNPQATDLTIDSTDATMVPHGAPA